MAHAHIWPHDVADVAREKNAVNNRDIATSSRPASVILSRSLARALGAATERAFAGCDASHGVATRGILDLALVQNLEIVDNPAASCPEPVT